MKNDENIITIDNDDLLKLVNILWSRPTGKVTWIIKGGVYELDYNFDPPKIKKIKEEE